MYSCSDSWDNHCHFEKILLILIFAYKELIAMVCVLKQQINFESGIYVNKNNSVAGDFQLHNLQLLFTTAFSHV